jgi:hypothetical protein
MRIFALALVFACGCEPNVAPPPKVADDRVYPVNPLSVARNRMTADAYNGYRVSVKLVVADCRVVGEELHVPATLPGSPPVVILKPVHHVPPGAVLLVAVGRCRVLYDGVRRSAFADFGVLIECEHVRTFSGWAALP